MASTTSDGATSPSRSRAQESVNGVDASQASVATPVSPSSPVLHYPTTPLGPLSPAPPLTPQPRHGSPAVRSDVRNSRRQGRGTSSDAGAAPRPEASSEAQGPGTDGDATEAEEQAFIWGTTVNMDVDTKKFEKFFHNYIDPQTGLPKYPRLLEEMRRRQTANLNIDSECLWAYDRELYHHLVNYPQELIPIFDRVVNKIYDDTYPTSPLPKRIQVRPYNLKVVKSMRDLNPNDVDQLIAIRGMVTRLSSIIPDLKMAFFRCALCGNETAVFIDRGRIDEPDKCENPQCRAKLSYQLIHNRCAFADKQVVKLQETPDAIPEGETPHTVTACAFDELVDVPRPGDRVEITGIYRAVPIRERQTTRTIYSLFRTFIDVIHFKKSTNNRFAAPDSTDSFDPTAMSEDDALPEQTEEQVEKIKELAKSPDLYDKLTRALAPSIYELDDVKKGLLCQLFGGTQKDVRFGNCRGRGDINVLLVGDPSTSKSQLLSYVNKLAPRGIYTSGKGSSAVGLTAYITRDPDTGELILESGALVLSDQGICCIDEFDKMSDLTRAVLHEAMEQQTVSVAKAGIICSLNARTSVLAAANPVDSRYNPNLSVVQNIQLPPTLLSRFDLIYLMLDKVNDHLDTSLARHLTSLFMAQPPAAARTEIDIKTLTSYISYARREIHPCLTDDASQRLIEGYVKDLRNSGSKISKKVISATPRQLESAIRIAEALAKMRLSHTVELHDVEEAFRLIRVATQKAAIDPTTGLVDMDAITTGVSAADRLRMADLTRTLKDLLMSRSSNTDITARAILDLLSKQDPARRPPSEDDLDTVLTRLANDNLISVTGRGLSARVRVMQ